MIVERGRGIGEESEGERVRKWSEGEVSSGVELSWRSAIVGWAREEAARKARGEMVL